MHAAAAAAPQKPCGSSRGRTKTRRRALVAGSTARTSSQCRAAYRRWLFSEESCTKGAAAWGSAERCAMTWCTALEKTVWSWLRVPGKGYSASGAEAISGGVARGDAVALNEIRLREDREAGLICVECKHARTCREVREVS